MRLEKPFNDNQPLSRRIPEHAQVDGVRRAELRIGDLHERLFGAHAVAERVRVADERDKRRGPVHQLRRVISTEAVGVHRAVEPVAELSPKTRAYDPA